MRMEIQHHTTAARARKLLEERLTELESEHGHHLSQLEKSWKGDTLHFSARARGLNGKGSLQVTDQSVVLESNLPLLAKPFEPRIRMTFEKELQKLFGNPADSSSD